MDSVFHRAWRALWLCLCAGLSLWSLNAQASGTVPLSHVYQCQGAAPQPSPFEACQYFLANSGSTQNNVLQNCDPDGVSGQCRFTQNGGGPYNLNWSRSGDQCPPNSTLSNGECVCDAGFVADGGTCKAPPPPVSACAAQAGKSDVTANFTIGWSRVGGTEGPEYIQGQLVGMSIPPNGSLVCNQGCRATIGALAKTYVSPTPYANGLYRLSADIQVVPTGDSCTSPGVNDANSPLATPPACDGFSGTVGGKPTCLPPSGASAPSGQIPPNPVQGNPGAGSDGSKPISDPGRQPSDGNGGNGGGPPTSDDGGKPGTKGGGGGGGGAVVPTTGASGGGSGTKGTDGKNTDGGACQLNPSAAGCGGAPASQPDLYSKKTASFGEALNAFKATVSDSAFGHAAGSFLTVSGGGTCPTFTGHVPYINADITIDQFCSQMAQTMFAFVKVALLVVAAFAAFKVALL